MRSYNVAEGDTKEDNEVADGDDDDEDDDDEEGGNNNASGTTATKKKKKKNNKKKKKISQTEPPTIPMTKMFPSKIYPEGEQCEYNEE